MKKIMIIDRDEKRRNRLAKKIGDFDCAIQIVDRKEVFINTVDDKKEGKYNLSEKNNWEDSFVEDLINIDKYDLIFLHIGRNKYNEEFFDFKCNNIINKIIGYTGGEKPKWFDDLKYIECIGIGAPAVEHFYLKDFLLDWEKNAEINVKKFEVQWNFKVLKGRKDITVLRYFMELNILLQGYLLKMKPEAVLGGQSRFVEKKLVEFGIKTESDRGEVPEKIEINNLFREYSNITGNIEGIADFGNFWFDESLPAVKEKRFTELKEAEPLLKYCSELEKLWKLLRGECGNKEIFDKEEAAQDDYTCLFERAYADLVWLFAAKKKADELENKRNILNHNHLKNEFIQEITSGLEANKSEYICLYWEKLCGESAAKIEEDILESRIGSIDDAFSFWPDLKDKINSFFNSVIRDYGFEFTGKGEKLKTELIDNKKSSLAIVDNFIKEFKKIAKESKSVRNKRLEEFFMALDNMHEKISDMSLGRNPGNIFNGYLAPLKK